MKRVLFRDWIPATYNEGRTDFGRQQPDIGTGMTQKDFLTPGLFHQWLTPTESPPVAIIQKEDGTIAVVNFDNVKFID